MAELLQILLGTDGEPAALTAGQMALRAAVVYTAGLAILRFGRNRLFGRSTAFDIILGIILGSLLSRAINGAAPLGETLAAAVVLVAVHWAFAFATLVSPRADALVKGRRRTLVTEGRVDPAALRRAEISESDLLEALRLNAHLTEPGQVALASLERNGQISVIPRREGTSG